MSKITLTDGIDIVDHISVIVLFRNNDAYIQKLEGMLIGIEKKYTCAFNYLFVENGSIDNTILSLHKLIKDRSATLISLGNNIEIDKMPRTVKIAFLRNFAKKNLQSSSKWTLIFDTDIYFNDEILFNLFVNTPSLKNIGMLCAYGVEVFPDKANNAWLTQNHYYDTFAYIDHRKKLFWPNCTFQGCAKCTRFIQDEKLIMEDLIFVESAFGGFIVIETELLLNSQINWESINHDGMLLCEHIGLCRSIKTQANKLIAISTNSKVLWDASTYGK